MRMEHATVLEIDQLMLSAPTDAGDTRAFHRPTLRRGDAATERGVMDFQGHDAPTDNEWAERAHGALDFR
jgi:hypothetical protein